jgi:hypothetical protein
LKLAVIIFHKNIERYPKRWIDKCIDSLKYQSYPNFTVYELDYGGEGKQVYEGSNFESKKLNNHAEAHNYLLDKAFNDGCEYAFNVNVDDYYDKFRIERQLKYLKKGYDVVSSDFICVNEDDKILGYKRFHGKNISREFKNNHNVIAHPVCAYSKYFWENCTKLKGEEIPKDDFELWKRSINDFRFIIINDNLLYYRIHSNNSGNASVRDNV